MARSSSSGDELRASLEARRDLGPEYEDSLVEGFLEKMDQEIDRRVDERVAARVRKESPAVRPSVDAGQRLALAIISLGLLQRPERPVPRVRARASLGRHPRGERVLHPRAAPPVGPTRKPTTYSGACLALLGWTRFGSPGIFG
jgi:hypothetical protein